MSAESRARRIRSIRRDLERRLNRSASIIVLLGAGGKGLEERRAISEALSKRKMIALVPEDDLPPETSPSLAEPLVLARGDVDLVFLNVESWGTATELGQLQADPRVAHKLRILVRPEYHPVHSDVASYLSDLYLTHLVAFGHVYPVDGGRVARVPSADRLVLMIAERHRQVRALYPDFIK
ncbi:MAG TPA: hypothetical protein VEO20_09655 [Thermoplasmata archaeon]|nr:hypothetical protein [Thermoplasmata archaeon]